MQWKLQSRLFSNYHTLTHNRWNKFTIHLSQFHCYQNQRTDSLLNVYRHPKLSPIQTVSSSCYSVFQFSSFWFFSMEQNVNGDVTTMDNAALCIVQPEWLDSLIKQISFTKFSSLKMRKLRPHVRVRSSLSLSPVFYFLERTPVWDEALLFKWAAVDLKLSNYYLFSLTCWPISPCRFHHINKINSPAWLYSPTAA
jgi:hypothetical protein